MNKLIKSLAVALMLLIVGGSAYSFSYFTSVELNTSLAAAFAFFSVALVLGEVGVLGVITQNPWIGRAKQSAGNMTLTTWKGKNVMKTKPLSVENPNTEAQQYQRNTLALFVSIYRQISAAIQIGFKQQAIGMSEYNACAKANMMESFTSGLAPLATFDPANFKASKGTIFPTVVASQVASAGGGDTVLTYDPTITAPGQSLSDKAIVACYNMDTKTWNTNLVGALRSIGTVNCLLPAGSLAAHTIYTYLFFVNAAGTKTSDSEVDTVIIGA